jgi:hypothetical protein
VRSEGRLEKVEIRVSAGRFEIGRGVLNVDERHSSSRLPITNLSARSQFWNRSV